MMKKLTFYAFILTVFISSYNGLSREVNNPNFLLNANSKYTYNYHALKKYVSLRPDYRITDPRNSNFRQISDCPLSFSVNVDAGTCGAVAAWTPPTTDLSGYSMVQIAGPTSGSTFPVGPTTITYLESDGTNMGGTCTFIVTVVDNEPPATPTLTLMTVDCDGLLIPPTTTDNCAGTITGITTDTLAFVQGGSTIINWTFDDGNGNVISVPQTYNYDDTTDPVIPTLADVTVGPCSGTPVAPTTTDNCAGTITGTTTTTFPITTQGTTVVTWTFDDGNGNVVTADQNVIVDDTTDPVIPTLADVTVGQCSGTPAAPTTTDNCAGTITGTTSTTFPITAQGLTVITWTFDDGNGNSVTANQNVTVSNTTLPNTPTLADVTGECTATATVPTSTDNCGATITGTTTDPLTYNTQGTHIITWTFDDGYGNSITVNQNVIINDVTPPVVPTLADVNVGQCSGTPVAPTTTDNCVGTITGTTTTSFPITTQGTTVVTWTFNDGNGNSITVNQNVIIDDITPPAIPTLADVTGQCTATATVPTTTDNCGATITGTTTDPLTYNTQGTHTITWNFNDGHGNSITVNQNVIIDDITDPVPNIATLPNITAECSATLVAPTATDNCSGTLTATTTDPTTYNTQGTYSVNWTYDDGHGNMSTQTQTVIIDDVSAPVFSSCPSSITTNNNLGACGAVVNYTIPTATDNCGTATVVQTDTTGLTSGSLFPIGTTT